MNKVALIYFFLSILLSSCFTNGNKCKILALSGGGDAGAYQGGAIAGLISSLSAEEAQWDVVSGISVGSFNSLLVGVHEKGKEKELREKILEFWRDIPSSDRIYENWPFGGIVRGLLFETGLYTTKPGYDYLTDLLKGYQGLKRDWVVGTVNVLDGSYKTITNKDIESNNDIVNAVMSSGAFPVFFPFGNIGKEHFMDGGIKYGTDVPSAVHMCEDKGYKHEDIIIDVVLCYSRQIKEVDPKSLTPVPILMRYFTIDDYSKSMGDLEDAMRYLPKVNFRYVIAPSKSLPAGMIPLRFDPKELAEMIAIGEKDAADVVQKGPGVSLNELIKQYDIEKYGHSSNKN